MTEIVEIEDTDGEACEAEKKKSDHQSATSNTTDEPRDENQNANEIENRGLDTNEEDDKHDKEERSAVFETRLEKAEEYRAKGNELFKQSHFAAAMKAYENGLYHSEFDELQYNFELMDTHRDILDKIRVPLLVNAAACSNKLGEYTRSVELCKEAIKYNSTNAKARFRLAHAYRKIGKMEEAKKELLEARKIAPNDTLILRELKEVVATLKQEAENSKEFWKDKLSFDSAETHSSLLKEPASKHRRSPGFCRALMDYALSMLGFDKVKSN